MVPIIKIVCLSTAQELVNFIGILALVRHYAMKPEEVCVDVLQTAYAHSQGWAENLRAALAGRGLKKVQFVPLSELGIEGDAEYNPMRIFRALETRYEGQEGLYWLYSGAQKAQSAGMAVYGMLKAQRGAGVLVSVENNGHVHVITEHRQELITAGIPDFKVRESIVLNGGGQQKKLLVALLQNPGRQVFPGEEIVSWPWGWPDGSLTSAPEHAVPLSDFHSSFEVRKRIYQWGKKEVFGYGQERSDPGPKYFEYCVAWRVQRFLRTHANHGISEVVFDLGSDPQFDVVLATHDGGIINIDAKMGGQREVKQPKYRAQSASTKLMGGNWAKLYYCLPWFPKYLNRENCDVKWEPGRQSVPQKEDHLSGRDMYSSLLLLWRKTDQDYGPGWAPQEGSRPPDDSGHLNFKRSLIIPFDAGDLFEQKLEALLCQ